MSKDLVRTGYDTIATSYTSARTADNAHPTQTSLLEDLADRLLSGARVLDAGCGAGVPVTQWLSERFVVTGVDFSEEQLRLARQAVPNATFLCRDMTALDFPAESFDAICSFYAIIHVPREEHRSILQSFHRLLSPGGFLLLCTGAEDLPDDVEEYFGASMYWSHYDAETNLGMVQDVDFEIIRSELVPETLDPDAGASHLFLLARKPKTATH